MSLVFGAQCIFGPEADTSTSLDSQSVGGFTAIQHMIDVFGSFRIIIIVVVQKYHKARAVTSTSSTDDENR